MKPIKVGIIGCGTVARNRHAPCYKLDKRCELVAVMAPTLSKAKAFAEKFNIPKYYNNLDDFLSEKLNVVSICTPPQTHAKLAITCMKEGLHTLVEKPMAMNTEEAFEMVKEARKQGVKLCVCHNFLFSHSILRLTNFNKKGKLGEVHSMLVIRISNLKRNVPEWYPSLPGGLFFDEAPHMLYLLNHFLPELKISKVIASPNGVLKQKPRKIEAYFVNGDKSALLTVDYSCSCDEWLLYLISEKAFIRVDLFRDTIIILGRGGRHDPLDVLKRSVSEIMQSTYQLLKAGLRYSIRRQYYGHDKLISSFITSIIQDTDPPVKIEDAIKVVNLTELILRELNLMK